MNFILQAISLLLSDSQPHVFQRVKVFLYILQAVRKQTECPPTLSIGPDWTPPPLMLPSLYLRSLQSSSHFVISQTRPLVREDAPRQTKLQLSWLQPESGHESRRGSTRRLTDWLTEWLLTDWLLTVRQLQSNWHWLPLLRNVSIVACHCTASQRRRPRPVTAWKSARTSVGEVPSFCRN
jgi:hypothetical protein